MRKQRFREDTAGTIRFRPPEGPVDIGGSTTKVTLKAPGGAELQAETAATETTIATTLDGAVEQGDDQLVVDAVTGLAPGERIWVGTVGNDTPEMARVRSFVTATKLINLYEPLRWDHADGVEVNGADITYALTTTHTATLDRNNRALWTYEVDGVAYLHEQTFDIVKHVFRLLLTEDDLRQHVPGNVRTQASDLTVDDLAEAAEKRIESDLGQRELRIDLVRSPDQFRLAGELAAAGTILTRLARIDGDYKQAAEDTWEEYDLEMGKVLSNLDWYDVNEDDNVNTSTRYWTGSGWADFGEDSLSEDEEGYTGVNYFRLA